MSSPPSTSPHLVSLVVQSKKALQHGEQLCVGANEITRRTNETAADILSLDTKVRWIAQGIQEQLKLAVKLAKSIERQNLELRENVKQWDKLRSEQVNTLELALESLGTQPVPLSFYESPSASAVFAQPSSDEEDAEDGVSQSRDRDRRKWKTLRDFVDERGIEEAIETMENDRQLLEDVLAETEGNPEIIISSAATIQDDVPRLPSLPPVQNSFEFQEQVSSDMAHRLESLAGHYDQMAAALHDKEAGIEFSEDDLHDMNRDTDELPSIIDELENYAEKLQSSLDDLIKTKEEYQQACSVQEEFLDKLDTLGHLMEECLLQQQDVKAQSDAHLEALHEHLATFRDLHQTYSAYQVSYNSLLLELERRRNFRDAADRVVREMKRQLEILREEELQSRASFYDLHGPNLPEDLCQYVTNQPTEWKITSVGREYPEDLPDLGEDLLDEAKKQLTQFREATTSI